MMLGLKYMLCASAAWQIIGVSAQAQAALNAEDVEEQLNDPAQAKSAPLNIDISTSFPGSEVFGIKLVNGRPTEALLDVKNHEPEPVHFMVVGGSLTTPVGTPGAPDPPVIIRNLTTSSYGTEVPAGESQSFTYTFATELNPADLQLNLAVLIQSDSGRVFQQTVFNGTVSIVEAPISFLDPQILFLYLSLAGAFGGVCYFIYQTWITRLFPQKRRGGKGGERARKSTQGSKTAVDPADQVSVVGADGPAVTTGSKTYDESWIPAEHLKRPEARRVGSGRPKSRAA